MDKVSLKLAIEKATTTGRSQDVAQALVFLFSHIEAEVKGLKKEIADLKAERAISE